MTIYATPPPPRVLDLAGTLAQLPTGGTLWPYDSRMQRHTVKRLSATRYEVDGVAVVGARAAAERVEGVQE